MRPKIMHSLALVIPWAWCTCNGSSTQGFWQIAEKVKFHGIFRDKFVEKERLISQDIHRHFCEKWSVENSRFRWNFLGKFRDQFVLIWWMFSTKKDGNLPIFVWKWWLLAYATESETLTTAHVLISVAFVKPTMLQVNLSFLFGLLSIFVFVWHKVVFYRDHHLLF